MDLKSKVMEYTTMILPVLLALVCVVVVTLGSQQARLPEPMAQSFVGEYSRDGQNWTALTPAAALSAYDGDLYLRGHFLREMEDGLALYFYRNHIGVSLTVDGSLLYQDDVIGMPERDNNLFASMCAREWIGVRVPAITAQTSVEIQLHNPHYAGNKNAYTEFLHTLCVADPQGSLLRENLEPYGRPFRFLGTTMAIVALLLLGVAVAAFFVQVPLGRKLVKLGLLILSAGCFVSFDTVDLSFWNEWNAFNTYTQLLSMMIAAFYLIHFISDMFTGRKRRVAKGAVVLAALVDSLLIVLCFAGVMVIYDALPYWIASQAVLCPLFLVCCGLEWYQKSAKRLTCLFAMLLFAAMILDLFGVGANMVWRSPCSKLVFVLLLGIYLVVGAGEVVRSYRASIRAANLEKELENSRTAIMLSQIKPHFLYNVLNAIYHLYRIEPETAQEAVSSFAEYLRCNMLSIEKHKPIPFREEYRHIQTYLSLEQIRFREKLQVVYDVQVTNFVLPPLTVEPLVENAVKHGVTKKRGGGVVTISTCKRAGEYLVTVADTGVGFDPDHYMEDGKPHIGIRNVRERLQSMVGGSLHITSTDSGTVAVVTIPAKEARVIDENSCSG